MKKMKFFMSMLCALSLLLFTACNKNDDENNKTTDNISTQTSEDLIALFESLGILTEDGDVAYSTETIYIPVEDEDYAIKVLEEILEVSFDTSGDKVTLADGSGYVNIVKSSVDGEFYSVTFSLNDLDAFKVVLALEEYCQDDNWKW